MSFLYALWIIPILGILIFLHELGHFVMARRAGVRVEEFGFGLPPRLWGIKRGDTIYSINLLPVGGFVRVLGEDGKSQAPDSMQAKTAWQRTKFLAAGSVMNFLTAFVLMALMVAFQGHPTEHVYVTDVADQSPAQAAGWQRGDRFLEIAGHTIDSSDEVGEITRSRAGESTTVVLERDGQQLTTTITPRKDPPPGQGATGIVLSGAPVSIIHVTDVPEGSTAQVAGVQKGDTIVGVDGRPVGDYLEYSLYLRNHAGQQVTLDVVRDGQQITLPVAVPASLPDSTEPLGANLLQDVRFTKVPVTAVPGETIRAFATTIQRMGEGLISLIRGQTPLGDIAGPIGMGQLTSEVISESGLPLWVTLANLMVILSLNLGILNLLPLPALDGGRLFFVLLEVLRGGKRVPPEKEGVVHFIGLLVLLTAMFMIAFVDINRIISGSSFLE